MYDGQVSMLDELLQFFLWRIAPFGSWIEIDKLKDINLLTFFMSKETGNQHFLAETW